MNDLISRQAALDEADEWLEFLDGDKDAGTRMGIKAMKKSLRKLPSAQPEQRWETCFDCPLSNGCPKIRGCTNDQAEQYASGIPDDCPLSVQPERKTGRWIYNSPVTMKCEQCGYVIKDWEWNKANYCAGCGADMKGEQNAVD